MEAQNGTPRSEWLRETAGRLLAVERFKLLKAEAKAAGRTPRTHARKLGADEAALAVRTVRVPGRGSLSGRAAEGAGDPPMMTVRVLEEFTDSRFLRRARRYRPHVFKQMGLEDLKLTKGSPE